MTPAAAFYQETWIVVNEGVYEPSDDTFLLCENLDIRPGEKMLELGTGSGLVAIVAAKAGAHVIATDSSLLAVQNARQNVILHNLQNRIQVRQGQLFEPIKPKEQFTLIAFNPPYLPGNLEDQDYDPAWTGGPDGRAIIDTFLVQCTQFLERKSRILLLQSSVSNPNKTQKLLKEQFQTVSIKAQKRFFFEELFLFEAVNPIR